MPAGRVAAEDVKLIPHRWDMHAIQALAQRDAALLARIFTEKGVLVLPEGAIDCQVQSFGYGAPMQFHSYGFFDVRSKGHSSVLFDLVLPGDTLVLIALRHHDPMSVIALYQAGASLDVANSAKEQPIEVIFSRFAILQLHDRHQRLTEKEIKYQPSSGVQKLLEQEAAYRQLFGLLHERLMGYHSALKHTIQDELHHIYSTHAPERLSKLPKQMEDFEYRERELLASVRRKYLESE
ncbi:hypothetical protein Poli38472_009190 [Pythium oligandrum]|uniref:Uncharacterized protein n=1 Tax=Pythium oligandrum TaxID=41045 RepID=A0A8K1FNV9_PYTOL|nr:hypothetical protein Poli38472_009190 [Pythium oligandrum]|eukprot:TMW65023.1 hypothetical protein Poli38472_009190 [Pythium oligandrum]